MNMRAISKTTILAVALILFSSAAFGDGMFPAVVVKSKGTVTVKRGDRQAAISSKAGLKWGDKVSVSEGGSAIVYFGMGKAIVVSSSLEITKENAAKADKVSSVIGGVADMIEGTVLVGSDLKSKGGMGATVRGGGDLIPGMEEAGPYIHIDNYLNTWTANDSPVFEIGTSFDADTTVLLLDEKGAVLFRKTISGDAKVACPEPLKRDGGYTLVVTSKAYGETIQESSFIFVLDSAEADAINDAVKSIRDTYKDDPAVARVMAAGYYASVKMYMEAAAELKPLLAGDPSDIQSHIAMANIYFATKNGSAFLDEMNRISALKAKLGDGAEILLGE